MNMNEKGEVDKMFLVAYAFVCTHNFLFTTSDIFWKARLRVLVKWVCYLSTC